jgi:hydrogenase maturation protein HypF
MEPSRQAGAPVEGRRIEIRGTVQGVGMRPFVFRLARALGVRGRVKNDARGVTIEAFADARTLDDFQRRLGAERPPAASLDEVRAGPIAPEAVADFAIVASEAAEERRVSLPPDLATCPACLAEVRDPSDRRHRYPFTNCTDCGPRFTIARDVPYDRAATTMAPFRMCPDCRREYQDPGNRRFHAEPNACPACGPRLSLRDAAGAPLPGADPLAGAAQALQEGRVVAVKGLGGFHLACDATSPGAVRRLRQRKRREEKPLAVMARDPAEAERLAILSDAERRLLLSAERPIVLVHRREAAGLCPELAPGSPLLGLFLPYTPLHHLLLEAAGRPLVMTSGNLSEEPIAFRDQDALARLGSIADLFLLHDREIESRADDSVARVVAGRPVLLRRSRGYVPRPVPLRRRLARPVLACGAHLKNAVCLAAGDQATLGPHVGDLENLETYDALSQVVERMERFLRLRPEVVACDLHPLSLSTRYARERAAALSAPLVPVQHHHAHLCAAMAEHGLEGPVLGLIWDGTGYGPDGAAWGGELLLADARGFERLATFRPLPLAGGDAAIREPWRVALAALDEAFDGDPPLSRLPLFRGLAAERVALVRQMIRTGLNAPAAHGAGRLFDVAGALALSRGLSRHEGQVAMALDAAADPAEPGRYPFAVDQSRDPWQLDWRPLVRALVEDLLAGQSPARVAARFHESLAAAAGELVRAAAARRGALPVVLSGGCFQNARLAEGVLGALPGFEVYLHQRVPPGDGGLALGQALVADAATRAS